MNWHSITCYFCGNPITNSTDYVKDKGKNGWRFHFNCHRKISEMRGVSSNRRAVYSEKFHMMVIGAEGKQYKLYP